MVHSRSTILSPSPHCLLLLLLLACLGQVTWSQTGALANRAHALQATSEDELAVYLQIISAKDPNEVLRTVDLFASNYPKSELLGIAYQYQMRAYESLANFDGMLLAGRKALAINPDNLNTLLTLAPALANHATAGEQSKPLLDEAERYARAALVGVEKTRPPRELPLETWKGQKGAIRCQAHEVLGVVAANRQQTKTAVEEFETVVKLAPTPLGSQYFRLGVALAAAGKPERAEESLRRAAALGPPAVRSLANAEMDKLKTARAAR